MDWQHLYLKYIIEVVLNLRVHDNLSINTNSAHLETALTLAQEASEVTLKEVHVVPLEEGVARDVITIKPLAGEDKGANLGQAVLLRIDDTEERQWLVEESPQSILENLPLLQKVGNLGPPQMNREIAPWALVPYPGKAWAEHLGMSEEQLWHLFSHLFGLSNREFDKERHQTVYRQLLTLNRSDPCLYTFKGDHSDFTIAMNRNGRWRSGLSQLSNARPFISMLPIGRLTMLSDCDSLNGKISAPYPFPLLGGVVEGATFEFFQGELTAYSAKRGEELLTLAFNVDRGARKVSGVTLIDNKLALPATVKGYGYKGFDESVTNSITFGMGEARHVEALEEYTNEEELAMQTGCNLSTIRVVVPLEAESLSITDGSGKTIMENGEIII
ncbi:MAG: aminopeptidase [Sphaerochaetaceae bacterium]